MYINREVVQETNVSVNINSPATQETKLRVHIYSQTAEEIKVSVYINRQLIKKPNLEIRHINRRVSEEIKLNLHFNSQAAQEISVNVYINRQVVQETQVSVDINGQISQEIKGIVNINDQVVRETKNLLHIPLRCSRLNNAPRPFVIHHDEKSYSTSTAKIGQNPWQGSHITINKEIIQKKPQSNEKQWSASNLWINHGGQQRNNKDAAKENNSRVGRRNFRGKGISRNGENKVGTKNNK
ncbi:hypothetical protein CDAR_286861 [Caerostris darwini]|uniref:Uncharacterized protein n=1 Tax=Caerostris darwini TaxID=1538125 RepID=A0AAV4R9D6_9ARAC|nr:hypothetical protein CDAR_286861 [Caerostris darwini]